MKRLLFILSFFLFLHAEAQVVQPDGPSGKATIPEDTTVTPVATPPSVMRRDTSTVKKHSPKTATILSLALPGAGQVYNRRNWWWKVPIIYGAGAALTYGVVFYNNNYNDFRDAYKYRIENNVAVNGDARFDKFQTATLQSIRESYREARDQCLIGLVAVYALQVVDAAVEAHFFDFNVSDNLSLNVQPTFTVVPSSTASLQLTLKIK